MKKKKGEIGYIKGQKIRRFLVTLILLAIPLLIFLSGYLYYKSRDNLLTVVAVVGCLPACKSIVGLIMMLLQKPKQPSYYREICSHAGNLTMLYELVFTSYEKTVSADAVVICGNSIVCLAKGETQQNTEFLKTHLTKMLRHNGYDVTVHVLTQYEKFLERLDSLNKNWESLTKNVSDQREAQIRHIVLTLAL